MNHRFITLLAAAFLSAASVGHSEEWDDADERARNIDPWERTNRKIFNFNDTIDRDIMEPLASGLDRIIPQPINIGVTNFFDNLAEISNIINNALQGKPADAVSDTGRLLVNSTMGIGGLFDPATHMGLEKHDEDFGQTLAVWGVKSGPYMVLPFLGPSTGRDTTALIGDFATDPVSWVTDWPAYFAIFGVRLIDRRIDLLTTIELLEQASLDRYVFQRDAWLQNREYEINDRNLATEDF